MKRKLKENFKKRKEKIGDGMDEFGTCTNGSTG